MSKREARSFAAAGVDVDAPRAKRRKEAPATATSTSPNSKQHASANDANNTAKAETEDAGDGGEDREAVREKGLQLWQTLKDAVNKEGQIASFQFMRLPSKRQYPDYYMQIKRPIALDDIKAKLDAREYASMEEVLQDLETCFRNAKRYNMRESQIWKDAKFLHKLATKEYSRITGVKQEAPADDADDKAPSDEEGAAKKKGPNMHRLLKTRLQKLVNKADDDGRVLASEFMELPSRKQWPMYYQIIKKPQALENIFKKLKRKEYHNPSDFANDVELVFSNALEFNQEHTQIWEDAVKLREYFRKLMADLPEPYTIPAYATAGDHPTKIKLKMPTAPTQAIAAPTPTLPSSNSITVPSSHSGSSSRAQPPPKPQASPIATTQPPRPHATVKTVATAPAIPPNSALGSTSTAPAQASTSHALRPTPIAPIPATPSALPQAQKPTHTGTLQPATFSQTPTSNAYYPNAVYQQPLAPAIAPKTTSAPIAVPSTTIAPAATPATLPTTAPVRPSPPSPNQDAHPLRHAILTIMPRGRRLVLHHEEGVKTWAMRLSKAETSFVLSNVTFLSHGEDEEESSGDEEQEQKSPDKDAEEGDASPTRSRKRGRPRKRGKAAEAKRAKGKATEGPAGVQVKLNNVSLMSREDGVWESQLPVGLNVLELGGRGGMVWKVYLDKAAY
ncbi:Bromodomain-containing protein [Trametes sanguinea]|nr:Bromodomain-containing protein [Trametes sanguinea]